MQNLTTKTMSVKEFSKIMDNPLQRDTEAHAVKALKDHMSQYHPSHAKVAVAKVGKVLYKLDGHTRSYLWDKDQLESPDELSCDIYVVETKEEAVELYKHFDSQKAVENKGDQILGALKYMGIRNYSPTFARSIGLANAIQTIDIAMGHPRPRIDTDVLLKPWKKEIKALISLGFDKNNKAHKPGFPSCVTAAFLILYRLYGDNCLGFWEIYYWGEANGLKSGRCGAKAAADYIHKARADKMLMGRQYSFGHIEAIITAYHKHQAKKPVTNLRQLYTRKEGVSTTKQLKFILDDVGLKV